MPDRCRGATDTDPAPLAEVGATRGAPSESTFLRTLQRVDGDDLDQRLGARPRRAWLPGRPRARAPRRAADAGAASRWTARACGADLPYTYLGADDRAGANYTGQPAVHSNYRQDG